MTWSLTWILVFCSIHLGEVSIDRAKTYRVSRNGHKGSDFGKQLEDDKAITHISLGHIGTRQRGELMLLSIFLHRRISEPNLFKEANEDIELLLQDEL